MPHCNKKMISFFLTTKCNLCCRYCYNRKERKKMEDEHKEQTIDIEIAKAGIDWYFANNDSRHIRFYGPGEPSQEFEILKSITEYAKKHRSRGKDVTVEIQTNGIFTEDVREWMLDNMNIMWISFDGMPKIQNYNRPLNPKFKAIFGGRKTAQILEDNIQWLNENRENRNLMVGARVTITEKNIDKQKEMIDYFYDLGIRNVWNDGLFYEVGTKAVCQDKEKKRSLRYVWNDGGGKSYYDVGKIPVSQEEEGKSKRLFDMKAYLRNYIEAYHYAKEKGLFWGSFLAVNFDCEAPWNCRSCLPLAAPHITTDGYISSCDMALTGSEPHHMKPFIVGKWNNTEKQFDFYYDKINELYERVSTKIEHCKGCPARLHCGGYCLGEIVNETGSLYGQNMVKCMAVRELLNELGTCPYDYFHP